MMLLAAEFFVNFLLQLVSIYLCRVMKYTTAITSRTTYLIFLDDPDVLVRSVHHCLNAFRSIQYLVPIFIWQLNSLFSEPLHLASILHVSGHDLHEVS